MRWTLIHKFLSHECTQLEQVQIEQWLEEDPGHKAFFNSVRKIWEINPKEEKKVDVKAAWQRFQAEKMQPREFYKISDSKPAAIFKGYRSVSKIRWYQRSTIYVAAAAFILLISVFIVVHLQFNDHTKISYQKVITAKGEKTNLRLSDGTYIRLNAESTLKIPSDYDKEKRTLYLKGEAFFDVKHDAQKPFRVYSKKIYTEDIGTRFNIRAFPEDSTIEVVVADGKVALGNTNDSKQNRVFMYAHERAVVSRAGKTTLRSLSDLSSYIGWIQDKLIFHDTPLREIVKQLERWYDVKCIVKNKFLLQQKLTATFQNESLSNVLKLVAKSMNVKISLRKRVVVFSAIGK